MDLSSVETPGFVIDESTIIESVAELVRITQPEGIRILYPLKTACFWEP